MLSLSQQQALKCFKQGYNLCITGSGGSGKSYCIEQIYRYCIEHNKHVQVCAMTGCAAVLLDKCKAQTLHSWAGIKKNKKLSSSAIQRWIDVDVLIVDEISMMTCELFEYLCKCSKQIRKSSRCFGGIQLVLSGDFYQLPPISSSTKKYCFESSLWNVVIPYMYVFKYNFRQKDDHTYLNILNNIRKGYITNTQYKLLQSRVISIEECPNDAVRLFPRRYQVKDYNYKKQKELIGNECKTYDIHFYHFNKCITTSSIKNYSKKLHSFHNKLLHDYQIEPLHLYCGSHVMCTKNLDIKNKISNGTTGVVISFKQGQPVVCWNNGLIQTLQKSVYKLGHYSIHQYPLILSYALSIHKCQGLTLNKAVIDCGETIFECGQAYVALSRLRSLNDLYLLSLSLSSFSIDKRVKDFYND